MAGAWLTNQIEAQKTLTDSGTVTVDLPTSNFIGSIGIRLTATNGATSNTVADFLAASVSKIEVVADSLGTLFSMTGQECRRFNHFESGRIPEEIYNQGGAASQATTFTINFGRAPRDTDCILPAKLFKTLQLKITYAMAVSATVGIATGTGRLDVTTQEYVSDENPLKKLILKKSEINSFTTAASGDVDVTLPQGNRLRRIMLSCYEAGIAEGVDITAFSLRLNNGTVIPVTDRWVRSQSEDINEYGLECIRPMRLYLADGGTPTTMIPDISAIHTQSVTAADIIAVTAIAGDTPTVAIKTAAAGAAGTTANIPVTVFGRGCVPGATMLDLDKTGDLSGCINTASLNDVKVRLTQGAAGGAASVVMEEVIVLPS